MPAQRHSGFHLLSRRQWFRYFFDFIYLSREARRARLTRVISRPRRATAPAPAEGASARITAARAALIFLGYDAECQRFEMNYQR